MGPKLIVLNLLNTTLGSEGKKKKISTPGVVRYTPPSSASGSTRTVSIMFRLVSLKISAPPVPYWRSFSFHATLPLNLRDSDAGVVPGPESVAEAKVARWIKGGGADNLTGPAYRADKHKDAALALGKGEDWTHAKILADNNIRPASVERRLELKKAWGGLKGKILHAYKAAGSPPFEEWLRMKNGGEIWEVEILRLNSMSKKCNEAIVSDSLMFNGLSPVRHSLPFEYPDRLRIEDSLVQFSHVG